MDYQALLKDPRWQKKRLSIFNRDNWTCLSCGRKDISLHVHHLYYFKDTLPWEYEDEHLVTYCELCHNTEHLIGDQIHQSLLDIIKENKLLIKPVSQICILAENWEPFNDRLRGFLNESMVNYLRTKKIEVYGKG